VPPARPARLRVPACVSGRYEEEEDEEEEEAAAAEGEPAAVAS
jgi:hypothetical protein